jgi:hypothetical protein
MPFQPGQSGNPNGRPKGARDRTTKEIKDLLNKFISKNLDDIQEQYDQLDPQQKLQFFERVLKYVLPQQRDINQTIDVSNLSESQMDELINKALEKDESNGIY